MKEYTIKWEGEDGTVWEETREFESDEQALAWVNSKVSEIEDRVDRDIH